MSNSLKKQEFAGWGSLLGQGVYTVPEAARLTGVMPPRVSPQRIRRWMTGYRHASGFSGPVVTPDIPAIEGALALSFRDLIEVQFIDSFLQHGVSWKALRRAAELAAEMIESSHPFSTKRFKTDGRSIFLEIVEESRDPLLLDLVARQYNIHDFVEPHLFNSLEFGPQGGAERWHPLWPKRRVVVDPRVSFGQPTVKGIPTYILAGSAAAEGSERRTAKIYGIDVPSVEAAVEFENRLAV